MVLSNVFAQERRGNDCGTAWVFGKLLAGSDWVAPRNAEAVCRGSGHGLALAEGDRSLRLKGITDVPSGSKGLQHWHWVPRVFRANTTASLKRNPLSAPREPGPRLLPGGGCDPASLALSLALLAPSPVPCGWAPGRAEQALAESLGRLNPPPRWILL